MPFCPKCGTPIKSETAKFCPKCGAPLKSTEAGGPKESKSETELDSGATIRPDTGGGTYWDSPGLYTTYTSGQAYIREDKDNEIYKKYKTSKEYNPTWLNVKQQSLILEPGDMPILDKWTTISVDTKRSIKHSARKTGETVFWFGIYALLMYFLFDAGTGRINAAVQAFFFPLLMYVYGSYKSLRRYLWGVATSLLVTYFILVPLYNRHLINISGIIFLFPLIIISDLIPNAIAALEQEARQIGFVPFVFSVLLITFLIELILLAIFWLAHRNKRVEMVISQSSLFLREKTKVSFWYTIKPLLLLIMNPFNIVAVKDFRKRIKINRMSKKEGRIYDFARIRKESIREYEKKENSMVGGIIATVLIILFGLGVNFPLLFIIALIIFVKTIRAKGKYTITLKLNISLVEGSWIKVNDIDIIKLLRIPPELVQYFDKFFQTP